MVDRIDDLQRLMRVLADPARLSILLYLARVGVSNVTRMTAALGMAESSPSHHLGILRRFQLVRTRQMGRATLYSLNSLSSDFGAHATVADAVTTLTLYGGGFELTVRSKVEVTARGGSREK